MSRAFVKETLRLRNAPRADGRRQDCHQERSTADGAERLQARLAELGNAEKPDAWEISRLEQILSAATIVEPQANP
jgi:hypothetical protein